MSALPYPKYGIENLNLFPIYQTREDYRRATGEDPPPFDPYKPPKHWFDPAARIADTTRRNVIYDHVLALSESGTPIAGPDGRPMLELLLLTRADAAAVNIPGPGDPRRPLPDGLPVPCPLRPLAEGEELIFDFGGIVMVENTAVHDAEAVMFSAQDRRLLRAIAEKLGVA